MPRNCYTMKRSRHADRIWRIKSYGEGEGQWNTQEADMWMKKPHKSTPADAIWLRNELPDLGELCYVGINNWHNGR